MPLPVPAAVGKRKQQPHEPQRGCGCSDAPDTPAMMNLHCWLVGLDSITFTFSTQVVMKKGGRPLGTNKGSNTAAGSIQEGGTPAHRQQTPPRAESCLTASNPPQDDTSHSAVVAPVTTTDVPDSERSPVLQSRTTALPCLAAPQARRTNSPGAGAGTRGAHKPQVLVEAHAQAALAAPSSRVTTPIIPHPPVEAVSVKEDIETLGSGTSSRRGTSDKVALPQRFRQARSSQVLPIPAEYRSGPGQTVSNAQHAANTVDGWYEPQGP
jgi:hypothetical protein